MKKLKCIFTVFVFVVLLLGCKKENQENHVYDYEEGDLTIALQEVNGEIFVFVEGDVTTEFNMTSEKKWVLSGAVNVIGKGHLIIQAGTEVFGNVSTEPSYLSVKDNGRLSAIGTPEENIVFTSINKKVGVPSQQDWGGVFMDGEKPVDVSGNTHQVDSFEVYIEEDGSGSLEHVSIQYAEKSISISN
ncbi:MAG: hypothetical protein CMD20_05240 [Flavobacteriales bacterium]|nr:hypothetical protein [Flavobacteriales bacterium]|tara:strand:- start:3786 stop:4349 length:564 start_codon:yes stop_codon:yes gene_type:complete